MKRVLPVLAAAALLAGCGSSSSKSSSSTASSPPAAPAASNGGPATSSASVNIKNFMFGPASVNVKVGGTVKWTNQDSSEHTATPDSGSAFDTGTLTQNQASKAISFKTAGTFAYHCAFHAFMHGTVVVS